MTEPTGPVELAVAASIAMLDRYGGLWSNDYEHVDRQLTVIFEALADLITECGRQPESAARETLRSMIHADAAIPATEGDTA